MYLPDIKALFIHVPKTGGTSIKEYFDNQYDERFFHASARRFQHMFPHNWNDIFKFAFVRNPWDRYVSMYHYRVRIGDPELEIELSNVSFADWLKTIRDLYEYKQSKALTFGYGVFIGNQVNYLIDDKKNICMDFIGRYESLQKDFYQVCVKLGIEVREMPHLKRTSHKQYQSYYDDETREIIQKLCWRDIEEFNYTF